jgi:patatin-like phospholipase/acyl hydrolase
VRGIVELEILRAIEKELGGGISVQDFFDLIVGTRYCSCLSVLTNEH